ncbi:MAG TPA: zinc-dependent metalloprotease [Pyrinomonadaceae bacterium]|nr:zinc-dependent metalloprotease [Pyrinomonadaceae bacterium]
MRRTTLGILLCSIIIFAGAVHVPAQDPTPDPSPGGPQRPGLPSAGSQDPQPYDRVITKDAKSKKGIFTVHQVKDKYYYEIPKSEFGKEFLWVSQIARTTFGVGHGGQALGRRVVRWELNENRVFLRNVNYAIVADRNHPIAEAVANANTETILMSFPVAAWGPDNASAVIDIARLFTTDIFEFSARQRLNANTMDASRSFIERISAYPENIEAQASHTYNRLATPAGAGGGQGPGGGQQQQGMPPGSATVVLHHSMVKLPENPMMPRLFDERVGYFSVTTMDYSRPEHRAQQRRFITRWRLEKKDPNAAVSEPVKPIVYYIDRATPAWLVPFTKRGVEKWQKAFEAAGFKNAIIAKMAPSKAEDPDFHPEDARYSVIRWLPSTVENASGPHINDPRTGEILESDIQMHHNIMNLQRSWYFLQVGPLDPRVHKLPMPDDLMGTLVEYVVAHEVGHTLGFQHNMKASSMYPQEKVRDREWVKKNGHVSTLMDYSRFNYVAQPEDKIDPADLVPGIGPYDVWATMWGYKPIPNAKTSDDERTTLDAWAREQDTTPWYRFSTQGSAGSDPGELTEAVGDADAIASTTLGIANLKRVANLLVPATTTQRGEPYSDLNELYGRMLGQWTLELNHVAAIVGGFNSQQRHIGQNGVRFELIPKARQAQAVSFLNDNAFVTPTWAINKDILRRIEPIGALNRVRNAQNSVLNNLLSSTRFARMIEQQTLDGNAAYHPAEFLADVRNGVWSELRSDAPVIDAYRRNLQRSYLDIANNKLNAPPQTAPAGLPTGFAAMFVTSGDERAFYRAELRDLSASIDTALPKTMDRTTRIHLEATKDQIQKILDPKDAARPGASAADAFAMQFLELYLNPTKCWPDYVIEP